MPNSKPFMPCMFEFENYLGFAILNLDPLSQHSFQIDLLPPGDDPEFVQGLRLDLADPLAGDPELLADAVQRLRLAVDKAEPQFDDLALADGKLLEPFVDMLPPADLIGNGRRRHGIGVLQNVLERVLFLVADQHVQRVGFPDHLGNAPHLVDGDLHLFRDFFDLRVAAQRLGQLADGPHVGVDDLGDMDGKADGPRLVDDGPFDRLLDPPGCVGAELEAALVLELFHGPDQSEVAFLDDVGELQSPVDVLFADGDDEPQIGLDHLGPGLLVALGDPFGQFLLLFKGEKRGFSDLLEIILDRIEAAL